MAKRKTAVTTIVEYEEAVLGIRNIERLPELQVRENLDAGWSVKFSNDMTSGQLQLFPPVLVYRLIDAEMDRIRWRLVLADGFHRIDAALRSGITEFRCQIREGTFQDALLAAIASNQAEYHRGRPFTEAAKSRSAQLMILCGAGEPGKGTWDWSDVEIARRSGVSRPTVRMLRSRLFEESKVPLPLQVQGFQSGKPTGKTFDYGHKKHPARTPKIGKLPNGNLVSYVNGKKVCLGNSLPDAQDKLDTIVSRSDEVIRSFSNTYQFRQWLSRRNIHGNATFGPVGGVSVGRDRLFPVSSIEKDSLLAAVGRATLARVDPAHTGVCRVVLVGSFPPSNSTASELVFLAKQLTPPIEFMTPEEVVAEFAPKGASGDHAPEPPPSGDS